MMGNKEKTTFEVVVHKEKKGGYWAEVPSLPGCFTQSDSYGGVKKNIAEAIQGHLFVLKNKKMAVDTQDIFISKKDKIIAVAV